MRVGIVFGMEFAKPTGISQYVLELSKHLSKDHDIHLIINEREFNYPGLTIHRTPLVKLPWLKLKSNIPYLRSVLHINNITTRLIFNSFYNLYYSKKIKDKFKLDLVHSQSVDSLSADVVTMHSCLKAIRNSKGSHYEPNTFIRMAGKILFFPFTKIYLLTEKHILINSKKIITVSQRVKEEILENYRIPENKIAVIPNGVDLYKFKYDSLKRANIRNRYGIDENEVVLIFVGHMFKTKGLDFVMDAISRIEKIKLFVVGEDFNINVYKKNAIKAGIQNRVIFVGNILKGIEDFYTASDIFLLPSASEGFPLTSLEAAASGLPLIVTKVGGLKEFVIDRFNGFFVARNSEEIEERIKVLVNDENLRKQIGKNARKTAEKYSWDEVAKKTLQVYKDVIKDI